MKKLLSIFALSCVVEAWCVCVCVCVGGVIEVGDGGCGFLLKAFHDMVEACVALSIG